MEDTEERKEDRGVCYFGAYTTYLTFYLLSLANHILPRSTLP